MAGANIYKKKVPWVTLILVTICLTCHTCVLIGNCKTANAFGEIGASTGGWAKVGKGLARSLKIELDYGMEEVSHRLVHGLTHLGIVTRALEALSSLLPGNMTISIGDDDMPHITDGPPPPPNVSGAVLALLQTEATQVDPHVATGLALIIGEAVNRTVMALIGEVTMLMRQFFTEVRPALLQIGEWIIRFGDKIQSGISVFSVTMDRVQKLFDQIMSHLAGRGKNGDVMVQQVFGLLDASNTGHVTAEDLREVARLYRITALLGKIPEELSEKYDSSGDGGLDQGEISLLVDDESLPNIMPVVLRTYAKRLAGVAGQVGAAKQRDEIAKSVFDYFALVCSKNQTKVGWIADRLSNASLPMEFTADVIAQACFNEGSPDKFTTASIGEILLVAMYDLNPEYTMETLENLANATFWAGAGLNPADQPDCVGKATAWVAKSVARHPPYSEKADAKEMVAAMDMVAVLRVLNDAHRQPTDAHLLDAIPPRAQELSEEGVARFLLRRRSERARRLGEAYHPDSMRFMTTGTFFTIDDDVDGSPSLREQTVLSGQAAAPETVEFAQWLAANASQTASFLQDTCFQFTSESSNALDSFGTELQTMVSRVQAVLDSVMKYATPNGLQRLEKQIEDFEYKAANQLSTMMQVKLVSMLNKSMSSLEGMIHKAARKTGEWVGHKIGDLLETPLGKSIEGPMMSSASSIMESESAGKMVSELLGPDLAKSIANLTKEVLADVAGDALDILVGKALDKAAELANGTINNVTGTAVKKIDELWPGKFIKAHHQEQPQLIQDRRLHAHLLELNATRFTMAWQDSALAADHAEMLSADTATLELMKSQYLADFEDAELSGGTFGSLVDLIKTLVQALVATVRNTKEARAKVAQISQSTENMFDILDHRGTHLFDVVADFWRKIWVWYYCCLVPMNLYLVYYGFWAGGFFGGPKPLPSEDEEKHEPPATFMDRARVTWDSATLCLRKCHDTELCFWSCIIFVQILVLVFFFVSVGLCAVAGIKAFIVAGCAQVYILGDDAVCREQLANLRQFMSTFFISEALEPLEGACGENKLLTCQLIQVKLAVSGALTAVCSVIAVLLSLHLVVDSAVLHERARWVRLAAGRLRDDAEEDAAAKDGVKA